MPAVQYVNNRKHRQEANKAIVESNKVLLKDSGGVEPPWKQSKRQRLEQAIVALGEDELQGLVSQFKQATSKQVGDGILRAALALKKFSEHQLRSAFLLLKLPVHCKQCLLPRFAVGQGPSPNQNL